ncbi:hypothetical protein D3C72_1650060 [compost metagenome]
MGGVHHLQAGAVADAHFLPAEHADHLVAWLELAVLALHHFTNGAADHHLVERLRRGVRLAVVHAPAHIRVERQEVVAHQHLAVGDLRHGHFFQPEIGRRHRALGTRGQDDALERVGHGRVPSNGRWKLHGNC